MPQIYIPIEIVLWGLFVIICLVFISYLYLQYKQHILTLTQWLQHAEHTQDKLEEHMEHWGILLEKRLSAQDAHTNNISSLQKKIETLANIMSHDAHRGAYGESGLKHILTDMFPRAGLKFQHTLSNNRRVDAALWLAPIERWLCIDAKFPLEDFSSEQSSEEIKRFKIKIKKHIQDIHDRYYLPSETTEISVLFLPSEGLFVWLHQHAYEVLQYAHSKKVWIASPSTLPSLLSITISLMADHSIDKVSKNFLKDFQNILSILSSQQRSIQLLEKSLSHHQQHVHQLVQQHHLLSNLIHSIQHNVVNLPNEEEH